MKIELDNNQINSICNALNTHANHFDTLAAERVTSSKDTREFWRDHARELREITNDIIRQRLALQEKAKVNA